MVMQEFQFLCLYSTPYEERIITDYSPEAPNLYPDSVRQYIYYLCPACYSKNPSISDRDVHDEAIKRDVLDGVIED
jgi:hypothetical protein